MSRIRRSMHTHSLVAIVLAMGCRCALASDAPYEQPPINYSSATPHDAASKLNEAFAQGAAGLERTAGHGYLESLLKQLNISPSSQTLVFSKTSFQAKHISARRPRAVYFNDDTYVGYVPGAALIEVASS